MKPGIGKLTAFLADLDERIPADIIGLINERVAPPEPLTPDDVYVRGMYVVSDSVNSFGGRFPQEEHARLVSLLIDSPVMVGHRKDQLPVARTFHAEKTERDGHPWVKSYFYWPRNADHAIELKEKIDGGIVKECSISFTFHLPECSICGRDIRLCPHEPMQKILINGEETICHFNYRQIDRVLETSLVYRGAIPGTGIIKPQGELSNNAQVAPHQSYSRKTLESLDQLETGKTYLILPNYEGISLTFSGNDKGIEFLRTDGKNLPENLAEKFEMSTLNKAISRRVCQARLVGYQGKQRCSATALERFLTTQSSPVTRVVLFLYPDAEQSLGLSQQERRSHEVRIMPHRRALTVNLDSVGAEIMTRLGVEIWPLPIEPGSSKCFIYHPKPVAPGVQSSDIVIFDATSATLRVSLSENDSKPALIIHAFDKNLLEIGRAFIADLCALSHQEQSASTYRCNSVVLSRKSNGFNLEIRDKRQLLCGSFALRPIRLKGEKRYLFSRLSN